MEQWTLPPKVHKYLYKKDLHRTLSLLSDITALNTNDLFTQIDESYLRYVGFFRIQILMEWGYYREALAWACLECELYPDNNEGLFLKESIKKRIKNIPPRNMGKKVKHKASSEWGAVVGMRELKTILERDLIMPLINSSEYSKYNLRIPQGFLFYGPPGCGKTLIAQQIAEILKFNFTEVSPSTIGSSYVHGTQNKIKELFDVAIKNTPTLLFMDEFEAFVPDRNRSDISYHYASEVNEMLIQLNNAHKNDILVIAATNYINKIDPAILRPGRIDKKIFVGPPDYEARIEAFKLYLTDTLHKINRWDYVGEETDYLTFAEIRYIVDEARRIAHEQSIPVDLNILMKAILENPPSLNESEINKYLK